MLPISDKPPWGDSNPIGLPRKGFRRLAVLGAVLRQSVASHVECVPTLPRLPTTANANAGDKDRGPEPSKIHEQTFQPRAAREVIGLGSTLDGSRLKKSGLRY